MVPQRAINRDLLVPPNAGFAVPHLPVIAVIAVVDDVTREAHEGRVACSNCLDQGDADRGIRWFRVSGIVESCVSISDEMERSRQFETQTSRRNLSVGFLCAICEREDSRDCDQCEDESPKDDGASPGR